MSQSQNHTSVGVPYQVKQLARMVVHGFYGREHGLIADILCTLSIVKEGTLCELLRLDTKHVRQLLASLKLDQIVKTKMVVETGPDGQSTRCNFYFIEYPSLLNMVKYKLELMRKKVETEERNTANRASFVCKDCKKTFSDLETNQLLDPLSMNFICTFCGGEVDEEAPAPQESQVMMAHFNEATSVYFDLIREIDSLNLSPAELQADLAGSMANAMKTQNDGMGNWSDERKGGDYNYIPQAITISIGEAEVKAEKAREQPKWLVESTVIPEEKGKAVEPESGSNKAVDVTVKDDEVLAMLMRHETKVYEDDKKRDVDSDDDMVEVDGVRMMENGESGEVPRIWVAGVAYSLEEVTEDIVATMTEEEKEVYIRVGQEAYADMFS